MNINTTNYHYALSRKEALATGRKWEAQLRKTFTAAKINMLIEINAYGATEQEAKDNLLKELNHFITECQKLN